MKKDSSEEQNNSKIWGGRFSSSSNKLMEEFNSSIQFDKKPVDVLKKHAGTVPANINLKGYQLASNVKSNTPIKWNFLSKVTLVKKGQIVDVFASGNGIYVTMKGMALEDGVSGGNVTVKNLSSKKEFQAKALNENSVKVHL